MESDNEEQVGYRWEEKIKKSWDVIKEDESGTLTAIIQSVTKKRKNIEAVQRGILRYFVIILDLSIAMGDKDLLPNRLDCTIRLLEEFLKQFFSNNPLSQVAIVFSQDGVCKLGTELTSDMKILSETLTKKHELKGEPSIQNSLELSIQLLHHLPSHSSKEILVLSSSLSSCDPGNINTTIDKLKQQNITCSFISLSAEVYLFKRISTQTNGSFSVILNQLHLKELLNNFIVPRPLHASQVSQNAVNVILMGFPEKQRGISVCFCHKEFRKQGYKCPRCHARVCELPIECTVCGLMLVKSLQLLSSHHFLNPVELFVDIQSTEMCFACSIDKASYQCRKCKRLFCETCDLFIHDSLYNCPGCE